MNAKEFVDIRTRLGITQEQLATILGFSTRNAIANIEVGSRNPGKLVTAVMRFLNFLPKERAEETMQLLQGFHDEK